MKSRLVALVGLVLPFASFAYGQGVVTSASMSAQTGTFSASVNVRPSPFPLQAIAAAPYSAEQVSEHVQTLADGTHITQPGMTERLYRDSAGRTRTERPLMFAPGLPPDVPPLIEIRDPVAGFQYILDPTNRVAHRFTVPQAPPARAAASMPMNRAGAGGGVGAGSGGFVGAPTTRVATSVGGGTAGAMVAAGPSSAAQARPQITTESLGTQMIEGVTAEGRRITTTYPAGSVGNDRPIVAVRETWDSPDLHTIVLTRNNDPRSGENTTRLINISRAEPDAALFQPPPDYRIVDETGPVTITYRRP